MPEKPPIQWIALLAAASVVSFFAGWSANSIALTYGWAG